MSIQQEEGNTVGGRLLALSAKSEVDVKPPNPHLVILAQHAEAAQRKELFPLETTNEVENVKKPLRGAWLTAEMEKYKRV